jgi:hypothetical protein
MAGLALAGLVSALVAEEASAQVAPSSGPLDRSIQVTLSAAEPASQLAVRYYGSSSEARAILLANGLPALGRRLPKLPAGKTIRLPTSWSYRIRPGDTWSQLAADYLGDGAKGAFLARLNHKPEKQEAPRGHVILIPAVLEADGAGGLRLERLAALLLDLPERDSRVAAQAAWIRDFNGLGPGERAARRRILLPLPGLRLLGWYVPTSLPTEDPGAARRAAQGIEEARADLRKGRFVEALARTGTIAAGEGLAPGLRAELHLVRCTAFVALGRPILALDAAKSALSARPGWKLDPVQVSPKVVAVFDQARKAPSARPSPAGPMGGGP